MERKTDNSYLFIVVDLPSWFERQQKKQLKLIKKTFFFTSVFSPTSGSVSASPAFGVGSASVAGTSGAAVSSVWAASSTHKRAATL